MAVNENQPCLIMRWCGCRCSSGAEPALPNALLTHSLTTHSLTYHSPCLLIMMHSTLNLEQTQSQHHFTIWPTSSNLVAKPKYVYVNFQITVMKTDSWSGQQTAAVKTGRRAYFEQFFSCKMVFDHKGRNPSLFTIWFKTKKNFINIFLWKTITLTTISAAHTWMALDTSEHLAASVKF